MAIGNDLIDVYRAVANPPSYLEGGNSNSLLRFDVLPKIIKEDIDNGQIMRYFARQTNHDGGEIVEVEKQQYEELSSIPLYTAIRIPWKIRGKIDDVFGDADNPNHPNRLYTGVVTSNRLSIIDGDSKLPGLKLKLSNPLQFFQGEF